SRWNGFTASTAFASVSWLHRTYGAVAARSRPMTQSTAYVAVTRRGRPVASRSVTSTTFTVASGGTWTRTVCSSPWLACRNVVAAASCVTTYSASGDGGAGGGVGLHTAAVSSSRR